MTTKSRKRFAANQKCGHCGNTAPMEIVSEYSDMSSESDDRSGLDWDEGYNYEMLQCPACREIIFRRYYYHTIRMDPSDVGFELLYPSSRSAPPGLPAKIRRAFDSALRVRSVDPNAYGVLLGRVLELTCEDRGASGRTLDDRLRELAEKGEIPVKLVAVARSLRQLRNVGAHAGIGDLTIAEVPILDDLCRAIVEYVYSAPFLVSRAEDSLNRLSKGKRKGGAKAK